MTNEILQGEEQFHSKNYLSEMPCYLAKMRLKSAPQKLKFIMAKAISKQVIHQTVAANSLDRFRIVTHGNRASFSTKITLRETNNKPFSKNYWKLGKMDAKF